MSGHGPLRLALHRRRDTEDVAILVDGAAGDGIAAFGHELLKLLVGEGRIGGLGGDDALHDRRQGRRVLLAAADTFRAAAVEQLTIWAERLSVDIVKHHTGADPAAVAFDAVTAAIAVASSERPSKRRAFTERYSSIVPW